jgi:hypothetical protein
MTLISSNVHWSREESWKNLVEADAEGYFAYLPAVVVYNDLNFGFFDEIKENKDYSRNGFQDYRTEANGKIINKYFAGTALAQLPFFLVAHMVSEPLGYRSDGYSKPYIISITIASLVYILLGLIFLKRLLRLYGIDGWNSAIVLVGFTFGSNLFCYTLVDIGLSHLYSFVFITMFLYYGKLLFEDKKTNRIYLLGILLGLILLIRPINGIILFALPFLAGSKEKFIAGIMNLWKHKWISIMGLFLSMLIVSIQLFIYKVSTGSFFVYSYQEEGFNLLSPHMFDILFSYKKGLFLYTPIFLISLTGLYFSWKKSRFEASSLGLFLLFLIYILSSWWNWWYGGGFSSRVFVEFIPLFAILLGVSLLKLKGKIVRASYISLIGALIIICQIQTYQYRYYIIHYENMDSEKYWGSFLRIDLLF